MMEDGPCSIGCCGTMVLLLSDAHNTGNPSMGSGLCTGMCLFVGVYSDLDATCN